MPSAASAVFRFMLNARRLFLEEKKLNLMMMMMMLDV